MTLLCRILYLAVWKWMPIVRYSTSVTPTILKTLSGSQRYWCDFGGTATKCGQYFRNIEAGECAGISAEFIAEAQGADLRCFVVGNRIIATMQRIGRNGEFRANCHRGATTEKL